MLDAAQRLRALDSDVKIVPYSCRLTEENAEEIIQQYDIVVDGCDNFETRYLLGEVCMRCHKPYVYGAIQGFNGQVAVFDTDHHPVTYKDLYPEPMAVTPLMKAVVGTTPVIVGAEEIIQLFADGLEILHLRKPQSDAGTLETLLRAIPSEYHSRIVLHEHFDLAEHYSLRGIHLNRRNPEPPSSYTGAISRSCHSLEEVQRYKTACDYVFLSPIYDSISKEGYGDAFSKESLCNAHCDGIIDQKVYALGGITGEHLSEIHSLGFGGTALLGDIWQREPEERLAYLKQLLQF